jgi:hypothetical protein
MMRAFGQEDKDLAEQIRREEEFAKLLFKEEEKQVEEQVEEQVIKDPVVEVVEAAAIEELPPQPAKPAETNLQPPEEYKVNQVINYLDTVSNTKKPPLTAALQDNEFQALRKTVQDLLQKVNTLSWGGGGTGVVRYYDLDDHQYPTDVKLLQFNTEGPDSYAALLPGSIGWNPTEDCLNIYQTDNTTLQVGLEQYIRVKNLTGNTINNGTLVQFSGVNGGFDPTVTPLLANTTFDPLYTVGVVTEAIANGEAGRATTFGKVRSLNTTGSLENETWNIGDLLWANPAQPGLLTNIKPTAPNVAISIAAVTRVDATEGEILVRPTIGPRLFYGNFAQTANQALAVAGTAYPVLFDKSNFSSGHTLNANGVIISQVTGLFKYDVNYNITSSNSSRAFVYMWIRKNGIDQQNTALRFSIESNGGEAVPHGSFVLSMQPNDNVQMMIAATGTSISLFGLGASGIFPSAPSAVLSISQINQ